jgi:hypothetical protein
LSYFVYAGLVTIIFSLEVGRYQIYNRILDSIGDFQIMAGKFQVSLLYSPKPMTNPSPKQKNCPQFRSLQFLKITPKIQKKHHEISIYKTIEQMLFKYYFLYSTVSNSVAKMCKLINEFHYSL